MPYDAVVSIEGDPYLGTYGKTAADALQTLAALGVPIALPDGTPCIGVFISVETNAARFAFPGQNALGHVIAAAGSISIRGQAAIAKLKIGNSTASSNATLQITPYF